MGENVIRTSSQSDAMALSRELEKITQAKNFSRFGQSAWTETLLSASLDCQAFSDSRI